MREKRDRDRQRQTDRETKTDTQRDTQRDRERQREKDRLTDRDRDRQRQTDRDRETDRESVYVLLQLKKKQTRMELFSSSCCHLQWFWTQPKNGSCNNNSIQCVSLKDKFEAVGSLAGIKSAVH